MAAPISTAAAAGTGVQGVGTAAGTELAGSAAAAPAAAAASAPVAAAPVSAPASTAPKGRSAPTAAAPSLHAKRNSKSFYDRLVDERRFLQPLVLGVHAGRTLAYEWHAWLWSIFGSTWVEPMFLRRSTLDEDNTSLGEGKTSSNIAAWKPSNLGLFKASTSVHTKEPWNRERLHLQLQRSAVTTPPMPHKPDPPGSLQGTVSSAEEMELMADEERELLDCSMGAWVIQPRVGSALSRPLRLRSHLASQRSQLHLAEKYELRIEIACVTLLGLPDVGRFAEQAQELLDSPEWRAAADLQKLYKRYREQADADLPALLDARLDALVEHGRALRLALDEEDHLYQQRRYQHGDAPGLDAELRAAKNAYQNHLDARSKVRQKRDELENQFEALCQAMAKKWNQLKEARILQGYTSTPWKLQETVEEHSMEADQQRRTRNFQAEEEEVCVLQGMTTDRARALLERRWEQKRRPGAPSYRYDLSATEEIMSIERLEARVKEEIQKIAELEAGDPRYPRWQTECSRRRRVRRIFMRVACKVDGFIVARSAAAPLHWETTSTATKGVIVTNENEFTLSPKAMMHTFELPMHAMPSIVLLVVEVGMPWICGFAHRWITAAEVPAEIGSYEGRRVTHAAELKQVKAFDPGEAVDSVAAPGGEISTPSASFAGQIAFSVSWPNMMLPGDYVVPPRGDSQGASKEETIKPKEAGQLGSLYFDPQDPENTDMLLTSPRAQTEEEAERSRQARAEGTECTLHPQDVKSLLSRRRVQKILERTEREGVEADVASIPAFDCEINTTDELLGSGEGGVGSGNPSPRETLFQETEAQRDFIRRVRARVRKVTTVKTHLFYTSVVREHMPEEGEELDLAAILRLIERLLLPRRALRPSVAKRKPETSAKLVRIHVSVSKVYNAPVRNMEDGASSSQAQDYRQQHQQHQLQPLLGGRGGAGGWPGASGGMMGMGGYQQGGHYPGGHMGGPQMSAPAYGGGYHGYNAGHAAHLGASFPGGGYPGGVAPPGFGGQPVGFFQGMLGYLGFHQQPQAPMQMAAPVVIGNASLAGVSREALPEVVVEMSLEDLEGELLHRRTARVAPSTDPDVNQTIELRFGGPGGVEMTQDKLKNHDASLVFSIFDEMRFVGPERGNEVKMRRERRYLGRLRLPWGVLLESRGALKGHFRIERPPLMLGYRHKPRPVGGMLSSTSGQSHASAHEPDAMFVSLDVTLDPALMPPRRVQPQIIKGKEPSVILKHVNKWLESLKQQEGSIRDFFQGPAGMGTGLGGGLVWGLAWGLIAGLAWGLSQALAWYLLWGLLFTCMGVGPGGGGRLNRDCIIAVGTDLDGRSRLICRFHRPQRPPAHIDPSSHYAIEEAARYVSLIPFLDDCSMFPGLTDLWCTDQETLNIQCGDWEEHAILLCNYFNYIDHHRRRSVDSYVGTDIQSYCAICTVVPEGDIMMVLRRDMQTGDCELWQAVSGDCYFIPHHTNAGRAGLLSFLNWRSSDDQDADLDPEESIQRAAAADAGQGVGARPAVGRDRLRATPSIPVQQVHLLFNGSNIWVNVQREHRRHSRAGVRKLNFDVSRRDCWKPLFASTEEQELLHLPRELSQAAGAGTSSSPEGQSRQRTGDLSSNQDERTAAALARGLDDRSWEAARGQSQIAGPSGAQDVASPGQQGGGLGQSQWTQQLQPLVYEPVDQSRAAFIEKAMEGQLEAHILEHRSMGEHAGVQQVTRFNSVMSQRLAELLDQLERYTRTRRRTGGEAPFPLKPNTPPPMPFEEVQARLNDMERDFRGPGHRGRRVFGVPFNQPYMDFKHLWALVRESRVLEIGDEAAEYAIKVRVYPFESRILSIWIFVVCIAAGES